MIETTKLAPTVEAIDAWRARGPRGTHPTDPHHGVNIWTKAGRVRCVTGKIIWQGRVHYTTIRGEGSSNGCRETLVDAAKIVRAEGWVVR